MINHKSYLFKILSILNFEFNLLVPPFLILQINVYHYCKNVLVPSRDCSQWELFDLPYIAHLPKYCTTLLKVHTFWHGDLDSCTIIITEQKRPFALISNHIRTQNNIITSPCVHCRRWPTADSTMTMVAVPAHLPIHPPWARCSSSASTISGACMCHAMVSFWIFVTSFHLNSAKRHWSIALSWLPLLPPQWCPPFSALT